MSASPIPHAPRAGTAPDRLATQDWSRLTAATTHFDYHHRSVGDLVQRALTGSETSPAQRAVRLYYAVRDGINYEVFDTDVSSEGLRASSTAVSRLGFCLHKSIPYVAAVRSLGIPARLIASPVRNHLATPELLRLVGGEIFLHWLTAVHLDGRWIYATPVFNALMCRLCKVLALDFDGVNDSRTQPHAPGVEMTFLEPDRVFDDVDHEVVLALIKRAHPAMIGPNFKVPRIAPSTLHPIVNQ